MYSSRQPDPRSPFAGGQPTLRLVIADTEDEPQSNDSDTGAAPDASAVDAQSVHDDAKIIASDHRPLPIRVLSRIISGIRTAGMAWRMFRSIPSEISAAWRNATTA